MDALKLESYWQDIPVNSWNAITYAELIIKWKTNERRVRDILNKLSSYDNGDNYVLIRSARNKGFYKTDDLTEIKAFKKECLNKGKSLFAPVKKINRVLNADSEQLTLENNMRLIRELKGLKQIDVCKQMQQYEKAIDKSMLSKMENNVCLPTPKQLAAIAKIYGCDPSDLINSELYL